MSDVETDSDDELPPGWEERATLSRRVHYVNHVSKSTQWNHPRTNTVKVLPQQLPENWREVVDDNSGSVKYVNDLSGKVSLADPRLAFAVERQPSGTRRFDGSGMRQRFDANTKSGHVMFGIDLSDRVAIVTGASGGLGRELCKSLASRGCHVVLACRSHARGLNAYHTIKKCIRGAKLTILKIELSDFKSIDNFVSDFKRTFDTLDYLFLNAAIFGCSSEERIEYGKKFNMDPHLVINYLSNFYLTHKLLPCLIKSLNSTIVVTCADSHAHSFTSLDCLNVEDILSNTFHFEGGRGEKFNAEKEFRSSSITRDLCYNRSKLFLLMFVMEVNLRWRRSLGLRCLAAHPGNMLFTNLYRNSVIHRFLQFISWPFSKTLCQATSSLLYAAFSPEMVENFNPYHIYINSCWPSSLSKSSHPLVFDSHASQTLWSCSIQILNSHLLSEEQRLV